MLLLEQKHCLKTSNTFEMFLWSDKVTSFGRNAHTTGLFFGLLFSWQELTFLGFGLWFDCGSHSLILVFFRALTWNWFLSVLSSNSFALFVYNLRNRGCWTLSIHCILKKHYYWHHYFTASRRGKIQKGLPKCYENEPFATEKWKK